MMRSHEFSTALSATAPELSVVIPCYNESDAIEGVVREWIAFLETTVESFEILIINDGSTDGTGRILDRLRKEHKALRVMHQLNLGHDGAVRRGYEMARGRYILQIDANGRYEPGDFERMWAERETNRLVLGQRTHRLDNFFHRFLTDILRRMLRWFFKIELSDPNAPFRLMQRYPALLYLKGFPSTLASVDLTLAVLIKQEYPAEVLEVPVPYRLRRTGTGESLPALFARAVAFAMDLMRLRFKSLGTQIRALSAEPAH